MDQAGELLLQLLHVGAQGLEVIHLDLTLFLVDDPGNPSLVSAVLFMIVVSLEGGAMWTRPGNFSFSFSTWALRVLKLLTSISLSFLLMTLATRHSTRVRGVIHDRGRVTFPPLFLPDGACVSEKGN